jgi:hypothetical protein
MRGPGNYSIASPLLPPVSTFALDNNTQSAHGMKRKADDITEPLSERDANAGMPNKRRATEYSKVNIIDLIDL